MARRFLRLVTVDLALRLFALHRLTGFPLPDEEPPLWVQDNGGGLVLRHYLRRSGLTRRMLADRLGASYTTVDNWLDGKNRPSLAYVSTLARETAPPGSGPDVREVRTGTAPPADLCPSGGSPGGPDRPRHRGSNGEHGRAARTTVVGINGFSAFPRRSCWLGGAPPVALRHARGLCAGPVVVAGQAGNAR